VTPDESVNALTGNRIDKLYYRFLMSPCQASYRQPDTLMSLCGRNGPAYQETKLELQVKMGPHRALPACHIGTRGMGQPSTTCGNTKVERAVEVSEIYSQLTGEYL